MSAPRFPTPRPWSDEAAERAGTAFDALTHSTGTLGKLRSAATWWAGATGGAGQPPRSPLRARLYVLAADHGVSARGVSPPGPDSAERVRRLLARESATGRLADAAGVDLQVIDVGLARPAWSGPPPLATLHAPRIRPGTADFTVGAAMTRAEAEACIDAGIELARRAAEDGVEVIAVGEIGVGGSTAAAAVLSAIAAVPGKLSAGRGSGVDDAGLARKVRAVDDAIARHRPARDDGLGVLAAVGGLEVGAGAGICLGGAAFGVPVVLDGFVSTAGALVASVIEPGCVPHLLIGHRSTENGHWAMSRTLQREPLLDLDMSVAEGVGALLALQTLRLTMLTVGAPHAGPPAEAPRGPRRSRRAC